MSKIICLCLCLVILNGCAVAALTAGIGYAVYANKKGNAERQEADAKMAEAYNRYCLEMARINTDREARGMRALEVKSMEDWLNLAQDKEKVR